VNLRQPRIDKRTSPLRICFIPFRGEGNLGDEAMLIASLEHFSRKFPRAVLRAAAISRNGCFPVWRFQSNKDKQREQIRQIFTAPGNDGIHLFQKISSLKLLFRILKNSDFAIFNGGLWFHDYKYYSMLLPLYISILARLAGTRVAFLSISAGPIRSTWAKCLGFLCLRLAEQVSVRDQESRDQLQGCCPECTIYLGADPSFTLKEDRSNTENIILSEESFALKKGRINIGINIFAWYTFDNYYAGGGQIARFEESLIEYCRYLIDDCQACLVFIPTQIPLDTEASLQLAKRCHRDNFITVVQGYYPPKKYIQLIRVLDMVVAMRLHAHIFSIIAGTPFLSISYHSKISSLMQMIDANQITIDSHNMNPKDLQMITKKIFSSSGEIREHLKKTCHHLREAALSNIHQLDMLLNNQPR